MAPGGSSGPSMADGPPDPTAAPERRRRHGAPSRVRAAVRGALQVGAAYPASRVAAIRPALSRFHAVSRCKDLWKTHKPMRSQDLRRGPKPVSGPPSRAEKLPRPRSARRRLQPKSGRSRRGNPVANFDRQPPLPSTGGDPVARDRLQGGHGHRFVDLRRLPHRHPSQHSAKHREGDDRPAWPRPPETDRILRHDTPCPGSYARARPGKPRPRNATRQTSSMTWGEIRRWFLRPSLSGRRTRKTSPGRMIQKNGLYSRRHPPASTAFPCSATSNQPATAPWMS